MGYTTSNGRYANTVELKFTEGTFTASGAGSTGQELGDRGTCRLTLAVTAASGTTPTLDFDVETSEDNVTWRVAGSFAQMTAVGTQRKSFTGIDKWVRVKRTIGGTTPSFTLKISGDAC
jgi:hypothetical protein